MSTPTKVNPIRDKKHRGSKFGNAMPRVASAEIAQKYAELGYDGRKMLVNLTEGQKQERAALDERLERQRQSWVHGWRFVQRPEKL
ncbi:MAG: hypothetical protein OHK0023_23780 [Anaerolineae bacterium]